MRRRALALLLVAYCRAAELAVLADVADSFLEQSGQREMLATSGDAALDGSRSSNDSSRAQELEMEVARLKESIAREISLTEAARRERSSATRRLSAANASLASAEEELRKAREDAEEAGSRLREACELSPVLCRLSEPPQALLAAAAGLVGVGALGASRRPRPPRGPRRLRGRRAAGRGLRAAAAARGQRASAGRPALRRGACEPPVRRGAACWLRTVAVGAALRRAEVGRRPGGPWRRCPRVPEIAAVG
ncbi:unnamed protein product [Prorocentrum cordatum]|uniref:Uncharacterized protein n=1 Tax=Prorocentrum cordatum TaxID=2364126 RepID=A0ABN9SVZ3_9DINO|nr:unnamed protein product [Polarella glacialis]